MVLRAPGFRKPSMPDRVDLLIQILLDRSADLSDRDDAAIDLGEFDDDRAIMALINVAKDLEENQTILASCGESIAQIWLRTGRFDRQAFDALAPSARAEVEGLMRKQRPQWLK